MPKHPPAQEKPIRTLNKMQSFAVMEVLNFHRSVKRTKFTLPFTAFPSSTDITMLYAYVLLQLALFLICLGGYFQVSRFLHQHSAIRDATEMGAFKRMVKVNMYVALGYLILGFPVILLSLYLPFTEGLMGIGVVLLINTPIFLIGNQTKKLEMRSRELECSSALADEYRSVGETWHKKALPNF